MSSKPTFTYKDLSDDEIQREFEELQYSDDESSREDELPPPNYPYLNIAKLFLDDDGQLPPWAFWQRGDARISMCFPLKKIRKNKEAYDILAKSKGFYDIIYEKSGTDEMEMEDSYEGEGIGEDGSKCSEESEDEFDGEEMKESDDEFNGEDYEESDDEMSESDDEGKPTAKKNAMSKAASERYTKAEAENDPDHGLVELQATLRAKHGLKHVELFDEALNSDNEDVTMPKHQTTEDPDNVIIVKNQRVVAEDIGYKSYEGTNVSTLTADAQMRSKLPKYQLPTEKDSPNAYSRIKLMPYERMHIGNPYRPDMVFRFKCPFFYPGGREQVKKLQRKGK